MIGLRVICARESRDAAEADPTVAEAVRRCRDTDVEFVGARPGKAIDPLLTGRVLVLGDDADLAAVVLRLMRRALLGSVIVGFATGRASPVTDLWSLPLGAGAVDLARGGDPDLVPVVRDDVGGVLVGLGTVSPIQGTVYVDENRVIAGGAAHLLVQPDPEKGLEVTVIHRRIVGFGRRPRSYQGRAVAIGTAPATVRIDGRVHDRKMERWTFYTHTEPLRLVRGVL